MDKTSEGKLLELVTRISSDPFPIKDLVLYLVGQTADNQWSVIGRAEELYARHWGCLPKICLAESQFPPEKRKYPNFAVDWKNIMTRRGLRVDSFTTFRFPEGPVEHTGTEMMGLVAHAKEQSWEDVVLIATPWHQLRSFLSAVAATKKIGYPLRLWSCPGNALSWTEQSVHSQGVQTGSRADFIHAELDKVKAYSARGDISTIEEGIEYLNWRDAQGWEDAPK
ncbi:MAG: hypothetical protein G01um101419_694 [Parcubacteria group bacterium Gr01-1014_19]|nr:MAG: hypothetical protein G01um101419_694 [Parcubacteria group bacterium Gr01-1014_19]